MVERMKREGNAKVVSLYIRPQAAGLLLREDGDGGALDDTIVDLRQTMEQHQALLSEHLRVLQQTAERLRESRDARERRRGPPPAA